MSSDRPERHPVMGLPRDGGPRYPTGEEQPRAMGLPIAWFDGVDRDWLHSLAGPLRRYRQWFRHRRDGRG